MTDDKRCDHCVEVDRLTEKLKGSGPGKVVRPGATHKCEACGHDMPGYAVWSFNTDDGDEYWLCNDTESCLTRLGGLARTGEASYLALALGQLTKRVIALERWRQSEKDGGR